MLVVPDYFVLVVEHCFISCQIVNSYLVWGGISLYYAEVIIYRYKAYIRLDIPLVVYKVDGQFAMLKR